MSQGEGEERRIASKGTLSRLDLLRVSVYAHLARLYAVGGRDGGETSDLRSARRRQHAAPGLRGELIQRASLPPRVFVWLQTRSCYYESGLVDPAAKIQSDCSVSERNPRHAATHASAPPAPSLRPSQELGRSRLQNRAVRDVVVHYAAQLCTLYVHEPTPNLSLSCPTTRCSP